MVSSLLAGLRQETTAAHEALHVHPALRHLTDESVTPEYYRAAIRRFYGFYAPLEKEYARRQPPFLKDFEPLAVLARLEHDLEFQQEKEPDSMPLPAFEGDFEFSLAYLYLREGSNLGGKFISRHLEKHLALAPGVENRFFWGYGPDTGRMWALFQQKLTQVQENAMVDGALTARHAARLFETLHAWMSR